MTDEQQLRDLIQRCVDEGPMVTSAGVSTGIDMALHLVAAASAAYRPGQHRRLVADRPELALRVAESTPERVRLQHRDAE